MIRQPNPIQAEHLENRFLTFANKVLAFLGSKVTSEGMPIYTTTWVSFTESSWKEETKATIDYLSILFRVRDSEPFWKWEESVHCAKAHWEAGVLPSPAMTDAAGDRITSPTFEQIQYWLVQELLRPVLEVIDSSNISMLDSQQLVASYRSSKEEWLAKSISVEVIVPLLNVEDAPQIQAISPHFHLLPFSAEEKARVWNMGALRHSGMGAPIDLMTFSKVQFVLVGSRTQRLTVDRNFLVERKSSS